VAGAEEEELLKDLEAREKELEDELTPPPHVVISVSVIVSMTETELSVEFIT
jgi:hypothetical protein